MHRILATTPGVDAGQRQRELETGRLVERAVRSRFGGAAGSPFLAKRAGADVAALEPGPARQALSRAVGGLERSEACSELCAALVSYGGLLERHCQKEAAVEAFETALAVRPEDPELMLHAARSHRKAGGREAALALYRRVREKGDARLGRFSSLGEALLDAAPEAALGRVLGEAQSAGDREVAAVALEERARIHRGASRWSEAVDDLLASALSYDDRRDRLRVAHALADLLLAFGDLDGAREALAAALDLALPSERDHAIQRLRSIARAQGDEVGLRRWPPAGASTLVSLMPARRTGNRGRSFAAVVQRWRDDLAG